MTMARGQIDHQCAEIQKPHPASVGDLSRRCRHLASSASTCPVRPRAREYCHPHWGSSGRQENRLNRRSLLNPRSTHSGNGKHSRQVLPTSECWTRERHVSDTYVRASTSIEGKRKTKLGNAIQVACQREQGENHIVTSNHEIVNHRRVGGFENIRPEHPTISIDDVVGHGVTAKMIGHVTET